MPPKARVGTTLLSSGRQESSSPPQSTPSSPKSDPEPTPKPRSTNEVVARVVWTLIMAYSFLALVAGGVEYILPVVVAIMLAMFREVVRISQKERKERQLPTMQYLQLYFLLTTVGSTVMINVRDPLVAAYPVLESLYNKTFLITFGLYVAGFVLFVLSLRRGYYRYQMAQFSWLMMTLVFIMGQGSLQYSNMLRGLFWFLLPISCVVHNDVWAYACGKNFGRTPLLRLSPKKTLEGFVGAWIMTTMWALWFAGFMCRFPALVCPKTKLFEPVSCTPDSMFIAVPFQLPEEITAVTGIAALNLAPVQIHAIIVAAFASLIAPFGGFFASGLKRAFKLKDFGDLIPGHGGMTDRMDCQIIMGAFTFVYVKFVVQSDQDQTCPQVPLLIDCLKTLSPEALKLVLKEVSPAA